MMKSRKAQGLSVNIVIIAVLALLVLVVLAVAFGDKVRQFVKGADDCESKKGECIPKEDVCDGAVIPAQECGTGKICCVKSGG